MDFLSFIVLILVILLSTIYFYIRNKLNYWSNKGVIYIKPTIPYGNFEGVFKTRHLAKIIEELYNQFKGKAKFAGIYFFFRPVALILDLDLIKQVLIKDFNYFMDRGFYHNEKDDPLTARLFVLEGERWKNLRNKLSPTFTSGKMKYMFPTIVDIANRLNYIMTDLLKHDSEIDMKDIVSRYTTDVIGTCAFGIECNSLNDPIVEFREKGQLFLTTKRNPLIIEIFINTFPNLARALHMKTTPESVEEFYMRIVRETVDYREKNNVVRNDFMQLLLELKNHGSIEGENVGSLTFNEIAAQAFLFFLAGFETSSTEMGFCLYELAMNPDIQEKLRNEILEVLKRYNGQTTYEAIKEMKYLEMVFNETMRIYPSVNMLSRQALKDYRVPDTNYVIEKGTKVFIPVHAVQNDPDIYENPSKFDPERFSPENVQSRHPLSFLPFGDGPRNCIGLRFGRIQSYVGLVELLANFKFSICAKTEIPPVWNLKSPLIGADKIYLKVEKISKSI